MKFIAGLLNKQLLENCLTHSIDECSQVRAAVAYANKDNMLLFEACKRAKKRLDFYGRYDDTVAVHPEVLKWFLDQANPDLSCYLVPDMLHAKVIWWVGVGAYVGSANLSDRAWRTNIEAGVYVNQDDLVDSGLDEELMRFFVDVELRATPLRREIYDEQAAYAKRLLVAERATVAESQRFEQTRLIARNDSLATIHQATSSTRAYEAFEKEWNDTIHTLRLIAERVAAPEVRPDWISANVPNGIQADQFLHAYYYKRIREGSTYPFETYFKRNKLDRDAALSQAFSWWRSSAFDFTDEARNMHDWAPRVQQRFARGMLSIGEVDFVDAISHVHAIRDHANKVRASQIELPDAVHTTDVRVAAFAHWLWRQRSAGGKSALETLHYVIWGSGRVPQRLWNAMTDPTWRIGHLSISGLAETLGLARPNDYPPRNMRTSKALRALGYDVAVAV